MLAKRVKVYLLASVFSVAIHVPTAVSQSRDVNCDKQETLSDLSGKCSDDQQYNEIDRSITNSTTKGDKANSGDHDNGHGNDPDHDDSSNPGKGGGNHGTGNNGKGNGPGK